MTLVCAYIYQASFDKGDGTLYIHFKLNFFKTPWNFFGVCIVKELSYIFCQSTFNYTFGRHQG